MSMLIFDEPPLLISRSLATIIGLNESIILQQAHYWLKQTKHYHDGLPWFYRTQKGWKEEFPWWSVSTIKRALYELQGGTDEKNPKPKLLVKGNYNKKGFDKTAWYTIDYDEVRALGTGEPTIGSKCTNAPVQDEPAQRFNLNQPIPKTTAETTAEKDIEPSESISRDMALVTVWNQMIEGLEFPVGFSLYIHRLTPVSWAGGVLTLHAPADVALRLRRRTGELVQRLQPVAPVPLVEVVIVNGT